MWTLDQAVDTARIVESRIRDWHVAIGGGVLMRGGSEHDLDLVLIPHCNVNNLDYDDLRLQLIGKLGWKLEKTFDEMHLHWRLKGSPDRKLVDVYRDDLGRRIDVIMVS